MNLLKVWEGRKEIWEAIQNKIKKDPELELIAEKRLEICKTCKLYDESGSKCAVPGTGPCCGSCGCSLSLKPFYDPYSKDACPLGLWDINLDSEL